MQRRPREIGTNRDFAHSTERRRGPSREISDRALLREAKRAADRWQARLEQDRRLAQETRR